MAFKAREVEEGGGYVSTITSTDLANVTLYADGCDSEEEMEEEDYPEQKMSLSQKIKNAVTNFTLPSPEEIKNSNFCKSFQQPLMVKSKVQNPDVQQNNLAITKGKTPAELSKISKLSDFPIPSFRKHTAVGGEEVGSEAGEEKKFELGYGTLPRSLRETKLITAVHESEVDDEELQKRMEVTKTNTPAQLSEIKSIKDIPIPGAIKHILDRPAASAAPVSNGNAAHHEEDEEGEKKPFFTLPEGFMETKLVTNIKECSDYGTLKKRQQLTETKSPAQLSAISGLSDIPIPSRIENLMKGNPNAGEEGSEAAFKMSNPLKDGIKVPESMKIGLITGAVVEDEEVVAKHKELVASKSVAELGKIESIADIPIPEALENLMKGRTGGAPDLESLKSSTLSLSAIASGKILPESLRETKLITNVKVEKDQEKLAARQTLIKNQTPMELGSVRNLGEFPIPAKLQNLQHLQLPLFGGGGGSAKRAISSLEVSDYPTPPPRQKSCNASIYESLPGSLRNEMIVRSRPISDEESKARMEIIRSKSPVELSQIEGLKDIPVPRTIEKLFEAKEGGAGGEEGEGAGEDFIQKYSTLPASMKTNLLVGVTTEDQEVVKERSETVKSKSVVELSEIHSVSDIPIPSTLQRLAKRDYAPVERKKLFKQQMKSQSTQSLLQNTLPRSLRETKLITGAKVEEPEILQSRRSLVEEKSVAELSRVTSLADVPVPSFFSKLASKSLSKLDFKSNGHLADPEEEKGAGIYATLPKSLNCELLVGRSVQDVSLLEERMNLVNSKSTKELAQIGSIKDFPVPDVVQRFYHKSMDRLNGRVDETDSLSPGKSMPSLRLPTMLTQPCIVKTKVEDPQVLLERQQIQQQKSIHELSKIRNLNEMPVPGNLISLPNVPLPKVKDLLQLVARTPGSRTSAAPSNLAPTLPPGGDTESQYEDEEEYSNLEEDSYEVISKDPSSAATTTTAVVPPEVEPESPQVDEASFGLATQIKGTPERSARAGTGKKKKPEPKNRRSQDEARLEVAAAAPVEDVRPPLPPKRSPQKSMSIESQPSMEENESPPAPVKGVLTLEALNGNLQVIKNEVEPAAAGANIQSRPLPAPPAPVRYGRSGGGATAKQPAVVERAAASPDRTLMEESQRFQTCRETLTTEQSKTLIGSADEDDNTMADSIVESLVSCTDTLICEDGEEDDEFDDDPYPSVNFDGGISELQEMEVGPRRAVAPGPAGAKRLEEGTQQLSLELMEHVESLKNTLDNMSNRLGARSRSRSSSRSRPHSLIRYPQEK